MPSRTPTPTPTPTGIYGEIHGTVWLDRNGDQVKDLYEPGLIGIPVDLLQEGVLLGTVKTVGGGEYRFTMIPPGRYQVSKVHPEHLRFSRTPDQVVIDLAAGETHIVNFGDWNGRPTYLPLILR